jgi:sugar phosphate isomerase/epimerase
MKQDFESTLAKVAQIDYKEVEFAGYFGESPQEVRKILDSNKLTSPSEHIPYETVEKKWPETLEAAHAVGQKFIVCPWLERTTITRSSSSLRNLSPASCHMIFCLRNPIASWSRWKWTFAGLSWAGRIP